MNIKSLLLGSAAALVAVTGARAADPIMPEAETAQYVRVCDVYGTGFFYIPGTETCLKVGGYVRLRYQVVGEQRNFDGDNYVAGSRVRGRVNFDAREETELGQLRAFVQLQATNTLGNTGFARNGNFATPANGVPAGFIASPTDPRFFGVTNAAGTASEAFGDNDDAAVGLDAAYLQLGGLTMGYLDSLWAERDGLLTDTDWSVGDDKANRISYTFATGEGFSAAVSLEDDASGDFAPDVVGQVTYETGAFSAYVSGVYDENAGVSLLSVQQRREILDFNGNGVLDLVTPTVDPLSGLVTGPTQTVFTDPYQANSDDGAFAIKAGASIKNFLSEGSELKVEGHYAFDPTRYATNDLVTSFSGYGVQFDAISIPIEKQIGVAYAQPIGPFGVSVSGIVGETFDFFANNPGAVTPATQFVNLGSTDFYALGLNVGYEVTKNFTILGEVTYRDLDLPAQFDDFDQTAGFIEFKRSF